VLYLIWALCKNTSGLQKKTLHSGNSMFSVTVCQE